MKVEKKEKHNTYLSNSIYNKIKSLSLLKKTLLVLFLILAGNFFVAKVFNYNLLEDIGKRVLKLAGIYTEPIPSITMESDGWEEQEEGSYQIIKSAKWNGRSEAKITLDVKSLPSINSNKDIIFVLDRSGSMKGDRIQKLKEDSIELIENVLNGEKNHQAALVTFSTESEIVTNFTKDKDTMINAINSMEAEGTTNYNAAFKNVMKVLQDANYHQTEGRELIIMFLTDGYPCEDTPNEVGTFALFKEQYPYSIVNGVEYEMGHYNEFSAQLVRVSDNQFKAWKENLDNVLLEAAIGPDKYEEFTITDTINNDYFEVKDKSDIKVLVNDIEVASKFDLVNDNGKQKVVWDLTENYVSGAEIKMEIKIHLKETYVNTDDTYPTNSELNIESKLPNLSKETHNTKTDTPVLSLKYEVIYDTNPPKVCNSIKNVQRERHYIFENVTKRDTILTCNGYIFKGWEVVEEDVTQVNEEVFVMPDHDVQVRGIWSKPVISKAMDGTVNEKNTLYRTIENDYNAKNYYVVQYKGEADDSYANPEANENIYYYKNSSHGNVIFGGFCWQIVRTTKTGGVKIIYNGEPTNGINGQECKNKKESRFLPKKSVFNRSSNSLAYVGYMYNKRYEIRSDNLYTQTSVLHSVYGMNSEYTYWFSQNFTYDSSSGQYTLVNPESHVWGDMNINDYQGWYFCASRDTKSCLTLYYLVGSGSYFGSLSSGTQEQPKYTFGKSYTKDGSGNYILQETIEVDSKDWYTDYSKYQGYYTCSNFKSTICSELYYIGSTSSYNGFGIIDMNMLFGNSFTYANGEYTLSDAKTYDELKGDFSSHHYTCLNKSGKCTSIRYYYYINSTYGYYIELTNGKAVENVLNEMLWADDVNQTDSTIKEFIDTWYEENIKDTVYSKYLEETIYCNDRSIGDLGGWNPNGGSTSKYLQFGASTREDMASSANATLVCKNDTDKFSVSNPKAKLKYPIGLLSFDETIYSGNRYFNDDFNMNWYTISPGMYQSSSATVDTIDYYWVFDNNVGSAYGVRPVISLVPNIEYSTGDGTQDNPYIIITN